MLRRREADFSRVSEHAIRPLWYILHTCKYRHDKLGGAQGTPTLAHQRSPAGQIVCCASVGVDHQAGLTRTPPPQSFD